MTITVTRDGPITAIHDTDLPLDIMAMADVIRLGTGHVMPITLLVSQHVAETVADMGGIILRPGECVTVTTPVKPTLCRNRAEHRAAMRARS